MLDKVSLNGCLFLLALALQELQLQAEGLGWHRHDRLDVGEVALLEDHEAACRVARIELILF